MSRFVRQSSYRHVFGNSVKAELHYSNLKPSGSAWDTDLIAVNPKYIALNYQVSGGGAFLICPLDRQGKLPDLYPLCRAHTAPVLDVAWSPFDDDLVASAGEDCRVQLTRVDGAKLEAVWKDESYEVEDLKPLPTNFTHGRKVGNLKWHPTAHNVLASASYEVKLWDVEAEGAQIELAAHPDMVQSMSFNSTGTLLATTCKDKKLRLFDVRAGTEPISVADSHTGVKASRVCWMGQLDRICTTGFSRTSDRQIFVWNAGSLTKPVKQLTIDTMPGALMPFWSDNNLLFIAGKGDGNIRYYEFEPSDDELFFLTEFKSNVPQRGMTFMPRRALNTHEHEIARAYKVSGNAIEPLPFVVPRKSESFQADIYPPAPSAVPALSAKDFFGGKPAPSPNFISLESNRPVAAPTTPATPKSASSIATPARTASEPSPASPLPHSTAARQSTMPASATPRAAEPTTTKSALARNSTASDDEGAFPSPTPANANGSGAAAASPRQASSSSADAAGPGASASTLQAENADLKDQLAERDTLIRNLELKLEKLQTWQRSVLGAIEAR